MYSDAKVLLGTGVVTGAYAGTDGEIEYYAAERGVVRAYRYRRGDKTADGAGRLIGYADAYARDERAVAYRRGELIVTEEP